MKHTIGDMVKWLEPFDFNGQMVLPSLTIERAEIIRDYLFAQQWQPIETAPKNGTWILLNKDKAHKDKKRPPSAVAFFDVKSECWLFSYWDGEWRSVYDAPTHWMPLPPWPEQKP